MTQKRNCSTLYKFIQNVWDYFGTEICRHCNIAKPDYQVKYREEESTLWTAASYAFDVALKHVQVTNLKCNPLNCLLYFNTVKNSVQDVMNDFFEDICSS